MTVRIKRIYEPAAKSDGVRVLVDRLWPRGITKDAADIDVWLKDIGPSAALRTWFGHKPERWEKFRERYLTELKSNAALAELHGLVQKKSRVTLLYSARDEDRNQAVVLVEALKPSPHRRGARTKTPATGSRTSSSR